MVRSEPSGNVCRLSTRRACRAARRPETGRPHRGTHPRRGADDPGRAVAWQQRRRAHLSHQVRRTRPAPRLPSRRGSPPSGGHRHPILRCPSHRLQARRRSAAHLPRRPLRSDARRRHQRCPTAATPDPGCVWRSPPAHAPALPPRRRPRRRQDDHGRSLRQGTSPTRRRQALPHCGPGRSRRPMARRALLQVRPALRRPD
jgi:hypothetical protein